MPLNPVASRDPHVPAHNAERDAINRLESDMADKIDLPNGAATGDLLVFNGVSWVTTDTRFFEGSGRPDGKFAAPVGSRYIDKNATQGAVEWVKRSGEGNTGWLCIAGDTGIRDISADLNVPAGAVVHVAYIQRIGMVVDMYFDLTMPNGAPNPWNLYPGVAGFGPGYARHAGLQDNSEAAASGTHIGANASVHIYKTVKGKRDRFAGTWLTREPWPGTLPGKPA